MSFPIVSRSFTALNQTLDLPVPSAVDGHLYLQVIGTGTLTLVIEDSHDGSTFSLVLVRDLAAGTTSGSITASGLYRVNSFATWVRPRIRCSAFTSGERTVKAFYAAEYF